MARAFSTLRGWLGTPGVGRFRRRRLRYGRRWRFAQRAVAGRRVTWIVLAVPVAAHPLVGRRHRVARRTDADAAEDVGADVGRLLGKRRRGTHAAAYRAE